MYSLIALDIDGTLIGPDGRVSSANRRAVARAREAGVRVVLCTGRSWQESEDVADQAGCDRVLVCRGARPWPIWTSGQHPPLGHPPGDRAGPGRAAGAGGAGPDALRGRGAAGQSTGRGDLPHLSQRRVPPVQAGGGPPRRGAGAGGAAPEQDLCPGRAGDLSVPAEGAGQVP